MQIKLSSVPVTACEADDSEADVAGRKGRGVTVPSERADVGDICIAAVDGISGNLIRPRETPA